MAGFAINLSHFLKHPQAKFSFNVARGYQESEILQHLTTPDQLEPKADNCTKVSSTFSLCDCSRCSMLFSCGNKFVIHSIKFHLVLTCSRVTVVMSHFCNDVVQILAHQLH